MNPILQMLNKNRISAPSNLLGIISSLQNGDPDQMLQQLMNTNPKFRQFVEANKGKSPEQIAQEYGIDMNLLNKIKSGYF